MKEVNVKLINKMQFAGKTPSGDIVLMDSSAGEEKNNIQTPMELLLMALGGCTGMDVVSILRKMKVSFESIEIEIKGEQVSEHPKTYNKIELVYKLKGENIPKDKVNRAIELSQEKYCSVSAMLTPKAEINYTIEME